MTSVGKSLHNCATQNGSNVNSFRIVIVLDFSILDKSDEVIGSPTEAAQFPEKEAVPTQPVKQEEPFHQQLLQQRDIKPTHKTSTAVLQNTSLSSTGDDISQTPICPIRALTPYRQRWTIKARCTGKQPIRQWKNDRGAGTVASVILRDRQNSEIQATFWKTEVDKFYDVFQVNRIYFISRGIVKMANRRFAAVNAEYEITLEKQSIVQLAPEDSEISENIVYRFKTIHDINECPFNAMVDLFGVILRVGDVRTVVTKSGRETQFRRVTLGDKNLSSFEITLWGEMTENVLESDYGSVLAVLAARRTDYNEGSLSTSFSSQIQVNPEISECIELKRWFESQKETVQFDPVPQFRREGIEGSATKIESKNILQLKSEAMKSESCSFVVQATIVSFRKTNPYYTACHHCNKKVQKYGTVWHCEKCSESFDVPTYRYILSCNISDHTASQWVNSFGDIGQQLLMDIPASQLNEWKEGEMEGPFDAAFDDASFRCYKFRFFLLYFSCLFLTGKTIHLANNFCSIQSTFCLCFFIGRNSLGHNFFFQD